MKRLICICLLSVMLVSCITTNSIIDKRYSNEQKEPQPPPEPNDTTIEGEIMVC